MIIIFDTTKRTVQTDGHDMNLAERGILDNLYIDLQIALDKIKPETEKVVFTEGMKSIPLEI